MIRFLFRDSADSECKPRASGDDPVLYNEGGEGIQ